MDGSKLLIGENWIDNSTERIVVINPASLKIVGWVPSLSLSQVEKAIDCAHNAFPSWSSTNLLERSDLLQKFRAAILNAKSELASLITQESGKPIKEALLEIDYASSFFDWYADCIRHVSGKILPLRDSNRYATVDYKAVGVAALITPFNFPAAMVARKMAPALASGCTVVLKPDSRTPLTAIRLSRIAADVGFPPGVINVVVGSAEQIGEMFATHKNISLISFTGSTEVGRFLMSKASGSIKKLVLELGGNAPFIISSSANLELAIDGIMFAKFRNNGQTCLAPNRFIVHKKLVTQFIDILRERISKLRIGDTMNPETDLGPLIDSRSVSRYRAFLDNAQLSKATILKTMPKKDLATNTGYFVDPVLILNKSSKEIACYAKEHFAPIIPIQIFEELYEAIDMANDTESALAAYFYSDDDREVWEVPKKLMFGMVAVNDYFFSDARVPFGGIKQAGLGREGSEEGLMEFLESRYIGRKFHHELA